MGFGFERCLTYVTYGLAFLEFTVLLTVTEKLALVTRQEMNKAHVLTLEGGPATIDLPVKMIDVVRPPWGVSFKRLDGLH